MARLPCTPFGSIRLRQGRLSGKGHTTTRQPPCRLTRRLCACSHVRTAALPGHEALSHTIRRAVFPSAANRAVSHARNCVVTALTGRPSTQRRSMSCVSARHSPSHAPAWGSRAWQSGSCCGASAAAGPRSRHAGWAGRGGSTRPPPESPSPTRDALPLVRSGDHATCVARVLRSRTRAPVFRPLPLTPTPLRHALLMAHLHGQRERPHARRLAIGAWRLRQEMLETRSW